MPSLHQQYNQLASKLPHIARSYYLQYSGLDYNNLLSCANLGLLKSKSNYKSNHTTLKTYSYHRIRGEILDHIRKEYSYMKHELPTDTTNITIISYPKDNINDYISCITNTLHIFILSNYLLGYSYKYIGKSINRSKGRICQIIKDIINTIRDYNNGYK